jgi:hypothetical protein
MGSILSTSVFFCVLLLFFVLLALINSVEKLGKGNVIVGWAAIAAFMGGFIWLAVVVSFTAPNFYLIVSSFFVVGFWNGVQWPFCLKRLAEAKNNEDRLLFCSLSLFPIISLLILVFALYLPKSK